jgi:hypothetical protein
MRLQTQFTHPGIKAQKLKTIRDDFFVDNCNLQEDGDSRSHGCLKRHLDSGLMSTTSAQTFATVAPPTRGMF